MTIYSHFDKSAVCASLGYYVGKDGSETIAIGPSGEVYQGGNTIMGDKALGSAYAGANYRLVSGSFGCSRSGAVDTGLTTVVNAVWSVKGRTQAGKVNTLDLIASPDNSLGKNHYAAAVQGRYNTDTTTGGYIWFKAVDASMDRATKRSIVNYMAIGT